MSSLPLPFFLVVKGLSLLLKESRHKDDLKGFNITPLESITHLVDDVLLFGARTSKYFHALKRILELHCLVTRMDFNLTKSCILFYALLEESLRYLDLNLPFSWWEMDRGFKYLGFFLKPNSYIFDD